MVDHSLPVQLLQFSDGPGVLSLLEEEGGKVSAAFEVCGLVCVHVHLFFVEMNC